MRSGFALTSCLLVTTLIVCLDGQENRAVTKEVSVVGTVDRIDRTSRVVNFRFENVGIQAVYVDPAVKNFDSLRVGDVVTVRYVESVIVRVRAGARLQLEQDTTAAARRGHGGQDIEQQSTAVVTIDDIDAARSVVTYRTADGRRVVRGVENKALLDGLKKGDRVEVTFTRERAISIER